MNDDKYTVAIEISSSKIMGVVTRTTKDGLLEVIAAEQEKGVETVRYGIIQNLDEASSRIARILEKLERHPAVAPKTIAGAYIGLSGRSLRSITTEVSLNLPDDTEISNEILDRLRQRALNAAIDSSLEVVDAVARVYKIGKTETLSPKGVIGNSIKATFDLIVCRPEMRRNIRKTLSEKVGIEPLGFIVTALACGQLILSTEQKRLGCMLVDMGAETTTVTIYKNGHLCYFATLPLGGRNITRDLQTLNLLEEHAEEIKQVSGNATAGAVSANHNLNGIKLSDISNIIVARTEEILANVIEQIEYAGMKRTDLAAGIICTGGGFQLTGIIDLLAQQSNMKVKRAQLPVYVHINNSIRMEAPELTQVVSVAYAGATLGQEECLEQTQAEEMPVNGELPEVQTEENQKPADNPKRKSFGSSFMSKLGKKMGNFFGNTEDDSSILD